MKKKKVLFICSNASVLKEKIMPSMMVITNKGYEIDVVTSEDIDIPFTLDKFVIPSLNTENYKEIKKDVKKLDDLLNEKRYRIVHTFDNYSSYLLEECKYKNVGMDLYVSCENISRNILKLKNIIKIADILIVNNEEDLEFITKKKMNSNVHLIYNLAIDFRKYLSLDIEKLKKETKKKFNLDDLKKYVYIPDIQGSEIYISKVITELSSQNSNIIFLLGEKSRRLEEIISRNNLTRNILVKEEAKFLELLLMSDAVVYTKIYNYDIMQFVYSLIFGIPVIVPKNDYLQKYVEKLKNGFFIDDKNVQQTILAIGRSINIPKVKLNELYEYNYNKISCFSVDKYVYSLSELYKEVTSNPPKDIYIIESLKKGLESEKLMNDIKKSGAIYSEIIVLENSVNDEKLRSLGAEIKKFDISTFNGKYKLKKYIKKLKESNEYNSFSVYGKVYKVLKNNKIIISNDEMVVEYRKI